MAHLLLCKRVVVDMITINPEYIFFTFVSKLNVVRQDELYSKYILEYYVRTCESHINLFVFSTRIHGWCSHSVISVYGCYFFIE